MTQFDMQAARTNIDAMRRMGEMVVEYAELMANEAMKPNATRETVDEAVRAKMKDDGLDPKVIIGGVDITAGMLEHIALFATEATVHAQEEAMPEERDRLPDPACNPVRCGKLGAQWLIDLLDRVEPVSIGQNDTEGATQLMKEAIDLVVDPKELEHNLDALHSTLGFVVTRLRLRSFRDMLGGAVIIDIPLGRGRRGSIVRPGSEVH